MLSYHAYPKDTIHTRAIARRLGAELKQSAAPADYLIFRQGAGEQLFDPGLLEYFRSRATRRGNTVLVLVSYVSSGELTARASRLELDWLRVLDPAEGDEKLRIESNCPSGVREQLSSRAPTTGQLRGLLLRAVGALQSDEPERKALAALASTLGQEGSGVREHFPKLDRATIDRLLKSEKRDDLFYLLVLLSQGYADRWHDLNIIDGCLVGRLANELSRGLPSSSSATLVPMGGGAAAKHLLSTTDALRQVMEAPSLKANTSGRFKVLLIDDDTLGPGDQPSYGPLLREIAEALFPGNWELHVWNPVRDSEKDRLDQLCGYTSLRADGGLSDLVLSTHNLVTPKGQGARRTIADLATEFDFILVDQLYRLPLRARSADLSQGQEGRGQVRGPALIRGLKRILRDVGFSRERTVPLPQIIALSRDDDPARIQDAMRSGARDYVLKSQLLRLPAVMAKIQQSIGTGDDSLHHSFPELFRLPNETQGLLRTVRIPAAHPLHRNLKAAPPPDPVSEGVAGLLRRIPKSDLHIHAGSCMSPEFLVVASAVGLARNLWERFEDWDGVGEREGATVLFLDDLQAAATACRLLTGFDKSDGWCWTGSDLLPAVRAKTPHVIKPGDEWMGSLAEAVRRDLNRRLSYAIDRVNEPNGWKGYQALRAFLHAELGIRDRLKHEEAKKRVGELSDFDTAFFGLRFADGLGCRTGLDQVPEMPWKTDNLVRIYLLTLAAHGKYEAALFWKKTDLFRTFRQRRRGKLGAAWIEFCAALFSRNGQSSTHSVHAYRRRGWRLPAKGRAPIRLRMKRPPTGEDFAAPCVSFEMAPIEYSVSTGLRSRNLLEYLEGCNFSGAEHLRHPFLHHLFAQQAVSDLVDKGVSYAELRASPDGYVDSGLGFEFADACLCLEAAFTQAQEMALRAYRSADAKPDGWLWREGTPSYDWKNLVALLTSQSGKRCPAKVSLIYVGKRHKSTREMILEAAAAAVVRPSGEHPTRTASEFVNRELSRCRVVGFDLAGKEVGNPPERFVEDFGRLSRLHIPLTVHAGENESSRFVEDAILILRAKRIGHGLSLTEDKGLLARVREDRVGIELCPMSNFQTSHFGDPESARPYPLRQLLAAGILVSINTDNPIVSHTNLVREFFQASYAWGEGGMPLWEALRLVRMGYVMSFLNLQERRALLEIVGQHLLDLFSDEAEVQRLRQLAQAQALPR